MALLTAPFPQSNPTALSSLVLQGMDQLRREMDARTRISQEEQDNWLAEGKMAASNSLGIQSQLADQRDFTARQQQNGFNNYLGLSKLAMEQESAKGLESERAAHAQYWLNGGPNANKPQALSDIPFGVDVTDDQPAPQTAPVATSPGGVTRVMSGGDPSLPAGGLPMPPADMAAPTGSSGPGPASNALFPAQQGSAIMAPPSSPPPGGVAPAPAAQLPVTQQQQASIDQLKVDGLKMASAHSNKYGRDWTESLSFDPSNDPSDNDPSQAELDSAAGVKEYSDQLASLRTPPQQEVAPPPPGSTSNPAPTATAAPQAPTTDLAKIPYNRQISLGGNRIVQRMSINGQDYLQFYARDAKTGFKKPTGEPVEIKDKLPADIAGHALPVTTSDGTKVGYAVQINGKSYFEPYHEPAPKTQKSMGAAEITNLSKLQKYAGDPNDKDLKLAAYNAENKTQLKTLTPEQWSQAYSIVDRNNKTITSVVNSRANGGYQIPDAFQRYITGSTAPGVAPAVPSVAPVKPGFDASKFTIDSATKLFGQ